MQRDKSLRNIADVHNDPPQTLKRILRVAGQGLAALFARSRRSAQRERLDLAGVYRVRARNCRELSARVHNGAAVSALLALAAEHEADAARLSNGDGRGRQRGH